MQYLKGISKTNSQLKNEAKASLAEAAIDNSESVLKNLTRSIRSKYTDLKMARERGNGFNLQDNTNILSEIDELKSKFNIAVTEAKDLFGDAVRIPSIEREDIIKAVEACDIPEEDNTTS